MSLGLVSYGQVWLSLIKWVTVKIRPLGESRWLRNVQRVGLLRASRMQRLKRTFRIGRGSLGTESESCSVIKVERRFFSVELEWYRV